jgi:hypothetical protein
MVAELAGTESCSAPRARFQDRIVGGTSLGVRRIGVRHVPPYSQVVNKDSNKCPADAQEIAETYVMGTLTAQQAAAFEAHYDRM